MVDCLIESQVFKDFDDSNFETGSKLFVATT